ncbi:autotransporter outer membrane beta-barrel domain-containing protein, partial [Yersinia pestis]
MHNKFKANTLAISIAAILLSVSFNTLAVVCPPEAPAGSSCDAFIANDGKAVSLANDLYITNGNALTYSGNTPFVAQYLRKNIIATGTD